MYDNGVGVLSQYGLTARTICRGRGAMLCETETGWKSIQEFGGARNKLELQCQLQEQLMRSGAVQTDCPLRNETGELVSQGEDGLFYVVREWHPGKECDTRSIPEIRRAASAMARLHKAACLPLQKEYEKESLISECARHNAEIRKIKKYISKKQKKNTFEKLLLGSADEFLEQGETAVEELKQSDYEQLREQARQRGNICHGEFNQHNILFSGGQDTVIHFDKWNFDLPEADLYHFMRKILEKHSWDLQIGSEILSAYEKVQPLQASERQNLRLRLSYPWKYWKLANHYYGGNKAWISQKNIEKLEQIKSQKKNWLNFIKNMDF